MATHQPVLLLGPDDQGRPTSAEEFASAEFAEPWGYEREGGRLIVMAPEGQGHIQGTSPWMRRLFRYFFDHTGIIEEIVPNAWVRVSDGTDRLADIGVYLAGVA